MEYISIKPVKSRELWRSDAFSGLSRIRCKHKELGLCSAQPSGGGILDPLGLVKAPLVLPQVYEIEQRFDDTRVTDPRQAVRCAAEEARIAACLAPGMKVAVTAGSRGVRNIVALLSYLVEWLYEQQVEPFVVGAMGSHGGGEAKGQKELLRSLGITEQSVGCPVHTSDEVTLIGMTPQGHKVYCDTLAFESDGIIVMNRVKPHTSFRGRIESGICKMMAVGLGKAAGATYVHRLGPAMMAEAIPAMSRVFIESGKILGALGILENAFDETAEISGIRVEQILEKEPLLLEKARAMMASLPVDEIDVLVVRQMGKNYSGTGMDTNILGRFRLSDLADPGIPDVKRVVALDLSPESHGNATGVSLADVITTRIASAYDRKATYLNSLTSTLLHRAAIPPAMDNDWAAVGLAVLSLGGSTPDLKLAIIDNTLHIERLFVSESLLPDVARRAHVKVLRGPMQVEFGRDHNLLPL